MSLRYRARRRGLTAIEYCFMLSFLFLLILLAAQHIGESLSSSFFYSEAKLNAAVNGQ